MAIETEPLSLSLAGWIFQYRPTPAGLSNARLLVQVHGWTGDEKVMWIFTRRLPAETAILSSRAPYPQPGGGYGWLEGQSGIDAGVDDFHEAVEGLLAHIDAWKPPENVDKQRIDWLGFSQGAALVAAMSYFHPERVRRVGLLSGFLPRVPEDWPAGQPLAGKQIFIAHGIRDELVSIERARQAAATLQQAGATVTGCEADVGHKLSLPCLKKMEEFFS